MLLTGLALVLLAAFAVGCGQSGSSAASGAPASPSESGSSSAAATVTPVPYDRFGAFAAAMQKYADMDIQAFEKLPRDERLQYAQYLMDKTVAAGDYAAEYGDGDANAITPAPVTVKNSGQEVIDSNLYDLQLALLQDDASDAQKAMSSVFYTVEWGHAVTAAYTAYKDFAEANAPVGLKYVRTEEKTESLRSGRDGAGGDQGQYKVVSYYDSTDAGTSYASFVYYRFTSYDGSEKAIWLMDGQTLLSRTALYSLGTVH
jgi:hypothetical protein